MGNLYIVATPIGNLKDITLRALETLKSVDFVLCEDTRETIKLLERYEISKPLVSYFQHSKIAKTDYILERLKNGENAALVTDAGTPGISDPGNKLVELVVEKLPEVQVIPLPGPSAVITALSISGFPTDKFVFMGFPPQKKGREKFFQKIADSEYTVVFYESSHRILKALGQLATSDKQHGLKLVVCRELTKKFETVYRGSAEDIIGQLNKDPETSRQGGINGAGEKHLKGEFVVVAWNQ